MKVYATQLHPHSTLDTRRVFAAACSRVICVPKSLSQLVLRSHVRKVFPWQSRHHSQERLAEVGLDPVCLMVDIVVIRIVGEQELERIPPDPVATVVIDRLDRAEREEEDGLADRHARELECDNRAEAIEEETLHRVVVQCAESIRDVEAVVDRVEVTV